MPNGKLSEELEKIKQDMVDTFGFTLKVNQSSAEFNLKDFVRDVSDSAIRQAGEYWAKKMCLCCRRGEVPTFHHNAGYWHGEYSCNATEIWQSLGEKG